MKNVCEIDWAVVASVAQAITGFLAIVLAYLAFKSQQEIKVLELSKFQFDIMPSFKKTSGSFVRADDIRSEGYASYSVELDKNPAIHFEVVDLNPVDGLTVITRNDLTVSIGRPVLLFEGSFPASLLFEEVTIILKFKDLIGTNYEQRIHGNIKDLQIDPPVKK